MGNSPLRPTSHNSAHTQNGSQSHRIAPVAREREKIPVCVKREEEEFVSPKVEMKIEPDEPPLLIHQEDLCEKGASCEGQEDLCEKGASCEGQEERDVLMPLGNRVEGLNRMQGDSHEGTPIRLIKPWNGKYRTRVPDRFDVDDLPTAEGSISDIFRARNCEEKHVILKHPTNAAWVVKGSYVLNDIFGREAKVMQQLDCENVLKCYEFIESEQLLVLEECDTNLANMISQGVKLQPKDIMRGILNGLKTIHEAGFVHNDLHPRNILMKGSIPKIADFGVCRPVGNCPPTERTKSIMPPEQLTQCKQSADCWAAGLILCCILSGTLITDDDEILAALKCPTGVTQLFNLVPELKRAPRSARTLIRGLLRNHPKKRIKVEKALNSAWFDSSKKRVPQSDLYEDYIDLRPRKKIKSSNASKDEKPTSAQGPETL